MTSEPAKHLRCLYYIEVNVVLREATDVHVEALS